MQIFNNSLKGYLLAAAIFLATVALLKIIEIIVVKRLKKTAKENAVKIDAIAADISGGVGLPLYAVLGIGAAIQVLDISGAQAKYFWYVFSVIIAFYFGRGLQKIFLFMLSRMRKTGRIDATTSHILGQLGVLILWVAVILVTLQNIGFNITALIAGLGIGGVAIAFALQNILSDIFAYFTIHFDKPFVIDDFIIVDNDLGVIKKIGLKSTRIQTLWGEELIMSNKELTEKRVHNFKKMHERRIHFDFSVVYETSSEKLKKIPQIVKDIFSKIKMSRLDRVHFKSFGESGLVFEVAYYVLDPDYNAYMDVNQELNLAIKSAFELENIEFAYPTQKLFISKS